MLPQNEILTEIKQTKFLPSSSGLQLLEHEMLAYSARKQNFGLFVNLAYVNCFTNSHELK